MINYISDIKLPQIQAETIQVIHRKRKPQGKQIPMLKITSIIESPISAGTINKEYSPLTERRSLKPKNKSPNVQQSPSIRTFQYSPIPTTRVDPNLFEIELESVSTTQSSIKTPPLVKQVNFKLKALNKDLKKKFTSDDESDNKGLYNHPQVRIIDVDGTVSEFEQCKNSIKSPKIKQSIFALKPQEKEQKKKQLVIDIPKKNNPSLLDQSPKSGNSKQRKVKVILCKNLKSLTPRIIDEVAGNVKHQLKKSKFNL